MKVSYLDSLPAGYRFTDEDQQKSNEILGWYFASHDNEMSPEQSEFTWCVHIAEDLKARNNFWPTREAVIEEIERVNAEDMQRFGHVRYNIAYTKEKQQ